MVLLFFLLSLNATLYCSQADEQFTDSQKLNTKEYRKIFLQKTGYKPLCIDKNSQFLCVLKDEYRVTTVDNTETKTVFLKIVSLDEIKNKPLDKNLIQNPEPSTTLWPKKARFSSDGLFLIIKSHLKNTEISVHKNPLFKEQTDNNKSRVVGGTIEKNFIESLTSVVALDDFTLQTNATTKYEHILTLDNYSIHSYRINTLNTIKPYEHPISGISKDHSDSITYEEYFGRMKKNASENRYLEYRKNKSLFTSLCKKAKKLKINELTRAYRKYFPIMSKYFDKKTIYKELFQSTKRDLWNRSIIQLNNREYSIGTFTVTPVFKTTSKVH